MEYFAVLYMQLRINADCLLLSTSILRSLTKRTSYKYIDYDKKRNIFPILLKTS